MQHYLIPRSFGILDLHHAIQSVSMYKKNLLFHRVPRHIWGHGFVKVGDTDLKRRFQVSWGEIINCSIITII
jgi:hypothetical protein